MSKNFLKDKPISGLDISMTSVKMMSIYTKKWTVLGYGSTDVDPQKMLTSLETDGKYLSDTLKELTEKKCVGSFKSNHVVVGIPTSKTFIRSLSIPKDTHKLVDQAVRLEAEQYIPIPVEQLYIDYEVTDEQSDSLTVMMCATPKKIVDNCTIATNSVGLRTVMVEPSILAVARVLQITEEGNLPTVIVDIGPATTDIAILDKTIKVTGGVPVGGNTLTIDMSKKMKISLEKAHQLKVLNGLSPGQNQEQITQAITPSLSRIIQEVKKVLRYYGERIAGAKEIQQIIIVGGGSNLPGIGEYFTNNLMIACRIASPWQVFDFGKLPKPARQFKPRYLTVAGLASVKPEDMWK